MTESDTPAGEFIFDHPPEASRMTRRKEVEEPRQSTVSIEAVVPF